MKKFILFCALMSLLMKSFAGANNQESSNNQPVIMLGEINDQSVGAESYISQVPNALKQAIQEQSKISAAYDQRQEEIAEEEDYYLSNTDMGYGMFDGPFGGYGIDGMYAGPSVVIPISNTNSNNNANQPPPINHLYESQLQNGDIVFKQW